MSRPIIARIAPIAPIVASFAGLCACLPEPGADLLGPQILASSLVHARSVEVSVWPELVVEFSEPLDAATVHGGSVALVAWELLEQRCALTPVCDEGSCERGRCQADGLTATQRNAVERGEFDVGSKGAVAIELELSHGGAGQDSRLVIRPLAPLDTHRRYSLLIGPALRDRSGAPLVDEWDRAIVWQRDFVTAGVGSAGPEPRLVSPAPGQREVPTNLAWIETALWPPIHGWDPQATLELEADDGGEAATLVEPTACPGWVPGTCLRWRPATQLRAGVRWRPSGGSLVDRLGRGVVGPGSSRETWFRTGQGPDRDAPQVEPVVQLRGRCLSLWLDVGEAVEARLEVGEARAEAAIDGAGWIGVELDGLAVGQPITWTLELRDLAGNLAYVDQQEQQLAGPSFDPAVARVRISEVLANPTGPEPDGEFVELQAGPAGALLDGVHLSDAPFEDILAAYLGGEDAPSDLLPTVELGPGALAIVAGQGWPSADWADQLGPDSIVLTTDASLGRGGLKNAGEALSLWVAGEQGPVLLAAYGNWIDTSPSSHEGRSVVADIDGCDLPDRWRSHPLGTASPGALP